MPFLVGVTASYTKKKLAQGACTLMLNLLHLAKHSDGDHMDREAEQHLAMQERQQMLEEALERAEAGVAKWDDWGIIRFECGVPRKSVVIFKTVRSESWL